MDNMTDLQEMVDAIHLGGSDVDRQMDELAAAIHAKLKVDLGQQTYRDMAQKMVGMSLQQPQSNQQQQQQMEHSGRSRGGLQQSVSADSGSSVNASLRTVSGSASFRGAPSGRVGFGASPPKASFRNRGRSPARSGATGSAQIPSNTPVRRGLTPTRGVFGGGSKIPLHSPNTNTNAKPHNRSPSPFSRFSWRGNKVHEEKKEEQVQAPELSPPPSPYRPPTGRESPQPDFADDKPFMRSPRPSPDRPPDRPPPSRARSSSPFSRAGLHEDDDDDSVSQPHPMRGSGFDAGSKDQTHTPPRMHAPMGERARSRSLTPRLTRPNAAHQDMDSEQPEIPRSRSKSPFMASRQMMFGEKPGAATAPTPRVAPPSHLDQDPSMQETTTPMTVSELPNIEIHTDDSAPVRHAAEPIFTPLARNPEYAEDMDMSTAGPVDPSNKTGAHKMRRKGATPTFSMPQQQQEQPLSSFSVLTQQLPEKPAPVATFSGPDEIRFEVDLTSNINNKNTAWKRRAQLKRIGNRRVQPPTTAGLNAAQAFPSVPAATTGTASQFANGDNETFAPTSSAAATGATTPFANTGTSESAFSFAGVTKGATTPRSKIFSPMDVESTEEEEQSPFEPVPPPPMNVPAGTDAKILFNMGIAGGSPRSRLHPIRRGRDRGVRSRLSYSQKAADATAATSPFDARKVKYPGSFSQGNTTTSSPIEMVRETRSEDLAARVSLVDSLREEGRLHYMTGDYRASILCYTKAVLVFTECNGYLPSDTLAVLLSNRGAGLIMIGAYDASSEDCKTALGHVLDSFSSDGGPVLKSKLYTRLGRAYLKQGKNSEASQAFDDAIRIAHAAIALSKRVHDDYEYHQNQTVLSQAVTEATLGRTEAHRLRATWDKIASCTLDSLRNPGERRHYIETLGHVNSALATASGSLTLFENKLKLLSEMKRWREVASYCERLAAENVRLDNVFTQDLEPRYPFLGVPPAKNLSSNYFGESMDDDPVGADLKLNSSAAAEAIVRLPHSLIPYYARALRLEERYPAAERALRALGEFVISQAIQSTPDFVWLPMELSKLNGTKTGREKGDQLFRAGEFDRAAAQYSLVLAVDSEEGVNAAPGSAGGRLHAVLHCNRGACFMALNRFQEALEECSAALRIHTRYMKALLRRSRCYGRLQRYQEAISEYKRWLELVDEAKRSPRASAVFVTPCLFDLPRDATSADISQVKRELDDMYATKRKVEAAAREEASRREERQRWHKSFPNAASQGGDAHRRREGWYNQQDDSRRWDSFSGRGPRSSSWQESPRQHQEQKPRSSHRESPSVGSPGSDLTKCHYSVLQIQTNASEDQIKKAFRKMALKFHPDKNQDPGASEIFRRAKLAYEVLNDGSSKRQYDRSRGYRNY